MIDVSSARYWWESFNYYAAICMVALCAREIPQTEATRPPESLRQKLLYWIYFLTNIHIHTCILTPSLVDWTRCVCVRTSPVPFKYLWFITIYFDVEHIHTYSPAAARQVLCCSCRWDLTEYSSDSIMPSIYIASRPFTSHHHTAVCFPFHSFPSVRSSLGWNFFFIKIHFLNSPFRDFHLFLFVSTFLYNRVAVGVALALASALASAFESPLWWNKSASGHLGPTP